MKTYNGLRFLVIAAISAVSTSVLWLLISSFRGFSFLEFAGGLLGLFIICCTFDWAFRAEAEPASGGVGRKPATETPVELGQEAVPVESGNSVRGGGCPTEALQSRQALAESKHIPSIDFSLAIPMASGHTSPGEPIPLRTSSEITLEFSDGDGPTRRFLISSLAAEAVVLPDIDGTTEPLRIPAGSGPSRKPDTLIWCGKGETIQIGPYTLQDPLVYTYRGRKDINEASCIDVRRRVGQPVQEPRGSLGYYPAYDRLSPDQRANYLQWLAGGRSGPLEDIGYAFLFFYGLERRLLVEEQDLSPIVKECVRLLEACGEADPRCSWARPERDPVASLAGRSHPSGVPRLGTSRHR